MRALLEQAVGPRWWWREARVTTCWFWRSAFVFHEVRLLRRGNGQCAMMRWCQDAISQVQCKVVGPVRVAVYADAEHS